MTTTSTVSQRRYDLDWLRVLAILAVFVFHSCRFFNLEGWHVKNSATYLAPDVLIQFLQAWMMPVIMVISGASAFFAQGKGSAAGFLKDKVLRLLVPLVVGIFTTSPIMVYMERVTQGQFSGSLISFLPHYFEGMYGFGGNFAWMGLHLWYLLMLFVLSLIFLPLFRWWGGSGKGVVESLGKVLAAPGVVFLLALPILFILLPLGNDSPLTMREFGGWSIATYMVFLPYGFIIAASQRLQDSIRRQRWVALILSVIVSAGYLYCRYIVRSEDLSDLFYGMASWFPILAILGFGMQKLNFTNPFLKYSNEAVLPFYILHQPVLLGVGWFVTRWAIPDLAKYLVIVIASFALIMALYEIIRRFNPLRFLFGMKKK